MSVSQKEITSLNFPAFSMGEFITSVSGDNPRTLQKRHSKIIYIFKADPGLEMSGHPVEEGDIFVVPLSFCQTYRARALNQECRSQSFVVNLLIDDPADWKGKRRHPMLAFCRSHFGQFRRIPGAMNATIRSFFASILMELDEPMEGSHLRICSLVDLLLVETARRYRPCNPEPVLRKRSRMFIVNMARDFMHRHLHEPITVGNIAWNLRLSQEHLSRVFRAQTGSTVGQELKRLRLEHATTLLRGSILSINEIARQCGFGNSALFCRTFKSAYRQTPGAYRAAQSGHYPPVRISK